MQLARRSSNTTWGGEEHRWLEQSGLQVSHSPKQPSMCHDQLHDTPKDKSLTMREKHHTWADMKATMASFTLDWTVHTCYHDHSRAACRVPHTTVYREHMHWNINVAFLSSSCGTSAAAVYLQRAAYPGGPSFIYFTGDTSSRDWKPRFPISGKCPRFLHITWCQYTVPRKIETQHAIAAFSNQLPLPKVLAIWF